MNVQIEVVSFSVCAVAFLALVGLVSLSPTGGQHKRMIVVAALATTAWAGSMVVAHLVGRGFTVPPALEIVRDVCWLVFLATIVGQRRAEDPRRLRRWITIAAAAIGVVGVAIVGAGYVVANLEVPADDVRLVAALANVAPILLAVIGLLLLENLFRNSDEQERWSIKHLCFGLGIIFVFDFYLYADAALFARVDTTMVQARGFVDALAVPLIAVSASRARSWEINVHVSRRVVFHTAALMGTGLYLVAMSGAGYYMRVFGGEWGPVVQILFFSGALLILMLIFTSGSARARFKVWISKNFFSYTYDYREEWLRFTQTISADDQGTGLHERIVRAVADIIDSTGGGLWVRRDEDHAFIPTITTNLGEQGAGGWFPAERVDTPFLDFLETKGWIVDLDDWRGDPSDYEGLTLPSWLEQHAQASVVVPLIHGERLRAFAVLANRRTTRPIDWETYDLLKAVARQAASYLAEEEAANALSDARRLEDFNRRFAFIVHDIKNLTSQMSLMLQNAERYGDNPEFQKDMLATVNNTVIRMKSLLEQFKAETASTERIRRAVSLRELVSRVGAAWRNQKPDLEVEVCEGEMSAVVEEGALVSVLDHLLQNALEATEGRGHVALRLVERDGEAVIEVSDDGPGMDAQFIRDELFRPLRSGKDRGYGLGAFQTRELVREMGGRLDVASAVGEGTTISVVLRLADGSGVVALGAAAGGSA